MKKIGVLLMVCLMSVAAQAALIDDFSDTSLAEYTKTVILEQDASFEVSFASPAGALQVSKSANTQAEQVLFMRDEDLGIGEILRVDKIAVKVGVYADFGIAVAASLTDPPPGWHLDIGYHCNPPKLCGHIYEGSVR